MRTIIPLLLILLGASRITAQANYDEDKVPKYTLPDPLVTLEGRKVTTPQEWRERRRPEILKLFQEHMYGKAPQRPEGQSFKVESSEEALDGKAIRKQITIRISPDERYPALNLLLYLPAKAEGPVPVFLTLNFSGNHTIHSDPGIILGKVWPRRPGEPEQAQDKERGSKASRWAVELILERGYGLATMYYGDIDPDFEDGFKNGVHPISYDKGQQKPAPDEWGSIGAWAWGLSRALDYLMTDKQVDGKRVAVMGHSRLGKTALWAGARDERFALAISNNSGCGGAALSRRAFGETVQRINTSFPHWFCDNFTKYNGKESELPLDQHMLIALMAPRPCYVASAVEDRWADPRGEHLSLKHADPVYELLGRKGLPVEEMPKVNQPVMGTLGYHIRSGKHDVTRYDWEQYLKFADMRFASK